MARPSRHSVGSRLRSARERHGLSLDTVAQLTKVSHAQLQAIEADSFQDLPAPVFVRGFVRSYGAAVGLDVDDLVRALPLSFDATVSHSPRRRNYQLAFLTANSHRGVGLIRRSSQVLMLVAISMLLVAWWMLGTSSGAQ